MESYKTKSRIITILTTVLIAALTYVSTMNPDQLAQQLGMYGSYASLIIVICASIVNQYSEEKRVTRAEELVENNYTKLGYPRIQDEDNKDEVNTTTDDIQPKVTEAEYSHNTENTTPEEDTHNLGDDEQ